MCARLVSEDMSRGLLFLPQEAFPETGRGDRRQIHPTGFQNRTSSNRKGQKRKCHDRNCQACKCENDFRSLGVPGTRCPAPGLARVRCPEQVPALRGPTLQQWFLLPDHNPHHFTLSRTKLPEPVVRERVFVATNFYMAYVQVREILKHQRIRFCWCS